MRTYSLRKSRHVMQWYYSWYKKKGQTLSTEQLASLEHHLETLDQALLAKDRHTADQTARKLEAFGHDLCKKSSLEYVWEIVFALVVALAIATVVRQVWFELYEIPTGSMRPTFREQDHLTVTKTPFGINVPLQAQHLYFDPDLVQRGSVVIWSGHNIDLPDTNARYFWILPYKKQYIKRLIGKPGDSLYFYGGKIYGVDKEGNPIQELLNDPTMQKLEHLPFTSFEGRYSKSKNEVVFRQMNQPIGRLSPSLFGKVKGEIFNGKKWLRDNDKASSQDAISTYNEFFGMRNFAMARLLTKEQLADNKDLADAPFYLELQHSPHLGDNFDLETTIIPVQQSNLNALKNNLYTARFVVKDGRVKPYSASGQPFTSRSPHLSDVPDGTYEFYFGKASKVGWGGTLLALPSNHPLYEDKHLQTLFNLGIDLSTAFDPDSSRPGLFPRRYAYFRNGDLYLLNAPIFKKEDPTLIAFNKKEATKQIPFKDYGPPVKGEEFDTEFIRTFGVTIPEKHYFVLGDNHAMSSDSRTFGFVPQNNLQGAPSLIIWPVGERWGMPDQRPYPIITLPRLIIWSIAIVILGIWYAWHRRKIKQPIFKSRL